jgi:hypothetical protein
MGETMELCSELEDIQSAAQKTLVAHQIELERLYSKNQTIPKVRAEFFNCEEVNFKEYFIENEIPVNFGLDLLVQMALHKRANLQTLIGLLYNHFNDAQITANMLLRAVMADLIDWDPAFKTFIVKFEITPEIQEDIDRFQYPLPMVVEPRLITKNRETGYYLNQGSVILRNNHHEDDVCLDHLNRMNSIKFTINDDTAQMVHNKWKNLDKPKEGELREEFEQRKKAFQKYDRMAKSVMALLTQHSTHFHLTHKYDKRGRVYCQGYQVNYQGSPWNKAVVEFAEKEYVK